MWHDFPCCFFFFFFLPARNISIPVLGRLIKFCMVSKITTYCRCHSPSVTCIIVTRTSKRTIWLSFIHHLLIQLLHYATVSISNFSHVISVAPTGVVSCSGPLLIDSSSCLVPCLLVPLVVTLDTKTMTSPWPRFLSWPLRGLLDKPRAPDSI